ncbi:hypothetical protein J6590_091680 [Homalodisca vitripennis]|nr:hypothetical protein J6590_091680 [Homalodisca vitripennis]
MRLEAVALALPPPPPPRLIELTEISSIVCRSVRTGLMCIANQMPDCTIKNKEKSSYKHGSGNASLLGYGQLKISPKIVCRRSNDDLPRVYEEIFIGECNFF